jgi:hypothetical protein
MPSIYNDLEKLNLPTFFSTSFNIVKSIGGNLMRFFTLWILVFHVLFHAGYLKQYQSSLLLMSIIVSVFGLLIVYYYPRKLHIPYFEIKIDDNNLLLGKILDLIVHQFPLIFLLIQYNPSIKRDNLILGLTVSAVYLLFNNPNKVYLLRCHNCNDNKTEKDTVRCHIMCGIINISVIILLFTLLWKLLHLFAGH